MNNTVIICVCSPERLSQYKVLYNSILKNVLNCDTILYYGGRYAPSNVGLSVDITSWIKETVYTDNWYIYCSLRPRAILDAFKKGYNKVILVGADTEFFNNPTETFEALNTNDAFVTMYTHEPYENDLYNPTNGITLEVGQINADFIAFKDSSRTIKFLNWLNETLKTKIVFKNKIYLDQGWFSMAFSFLDNVYICRHSGYNVGSYNAIPRGMKLNAGVWEMKDSVPLVLYHYDGFVKGQEERISKHQNRYNASGDYLQFLKDYGSKI